MSDIEPRVRPPADLEKDVLDPLKKIFGTKARALLFAGVLGHHIGTKKEIENYGEGIRLEYFDEDVKIIDLIAVAGKNDLTMLREDRRREAIQEFEEYAHTGLLRIKEACFSGQRTILEGIFQLLESDQAKPTELPGLI